MNRIFIGVDLGQAHDPTAIAVAERAELRGEWDAAQWAWKKVIEARVRMLERVPLGTPYQDVVERVVSLTRSPRLAGAARKLVVDGTGVGRPVVDLLRQGRPSADLLAVIVTAGETQSYTAGYYHVPKRDLISSLVLRFQQGTLKIAKNTPLREKLVEELHAMQVRVTPGGREQYGAWRTGSHDDLVFAVAMVCWAMNEVAPDSRDKYWLNPHEARAAEVFQEVMRAEGTLTRSR